MSSSTTTTTTITTTGTELWRHLPLLLQKSLIFCTTSTGGSGKSSVIYRLQQEHSTLKSLRLVGVEDTVCIQALSDALRQNTTLEQVSICGSFLQTLTLSTVDGSASGPIMMLFDAVGSLPQLTQLTLQGSEDAEAFSVAALTRLLQVQNTLETLSCQYIDLVASTSQSQDQLTLFTKALEQSTRLQKVQMTSLRLVVANNNTPHTTLDPIIQGLGHCKHVELAMRHRSTISKQALEAMLTTTSQNLQSLVLGRRISLTTQELDTILRCQQELQEIQLNHVQVDSDSNNNDWATTMAAVLHQSSSCLKRIDVTFATPCWTTTTTQTNTASPPLRLTEALKHNTSLQKLCLRGVIPDDQTHHYVPFLQVLEHDNTTLEELVLTHPECNNHNNNDNRQRKLQFFLQLNRQPLLHDNQNQQQQGFRTLLRSLDEAIPPHLVLPCLQAAQAVDEALHPPDDDDDDDDDDDLEEDFYGYIYHSPSWQATTQHKKKKRGTVSALYYLLRQQPSLIHLACQQQQSRRQKQQQPCDAMQGDSPQLLLLDDDIVALW